MLRCRRRLGGSVVTLTFQHLPIKFAALDGGTVRLDPALITTTGTTKLTIIIIYHYIIIILSQQMMYLYYWKHETRRVWTKPRRRRYTVSSQKPKRTSICSTLTTTTHALHRQSIVSNFYNCVCLLLLNRYIYCTTIVIF